MGWLASIDSRYPEGNYLGLLGENKWLIWLSFSISVSSATFGLTKFLKSGPFKILDEGFNAVGIGIIKPISNELGNDDTNRGHYGLDRKILI